MIFFKNPCFTLLYPDFIVYICVIKIFDELEFLWN